MFAKRSVRPTIAETYEEAEKVEAEMESIENYPVQLEEIFLEARNLYY